MLTTVDIMGWIGKSQEVVGAEWMSVINFSTPLDEESQGQGGMRRRVWGGCFIAFEIIWEIISTYFTIA